ncbi:MAG: HlyD family efflux transporter periplasmic adaptor subunit [Enhygromyxa sp.]
MSPDEETSSSAPAQRSIFREAALAAHRESDRPGRPLELVPLWTRLAEIVIFVVLLAGLIFAAVAEIGEYAEGVAVVRREGRTIVTAATAGTVARIEVETGRRVAADEVLVRLDDAAERAAFELAKRHYERQLVEALRDPADLGKRERLTSADAALQQAEAKLRERTIVAPCEAVVSDVRVRPGQPVTPGDAVIALELADARTVVVGLFPGHVRPLLDPETPLLLELEGFPDSRHELVIRSVADEVVGPHEAMRYLGRDRQGAIELAGPIVVVETELPSDRFVVDDAQYQLFDGMQGTVEAKLRSATILQILRESLLEG